MTVYGGTKLRTLSSFYAARAGFTGGVFVAAGDTDGDGRAEVITGWGPFRPLDILTAANAPSPDGPFVTVRDGSGQPRSTFLAYPLTFPGGVRVGTTDRNGEGKASILTGPGPGGGPQVEAFDANAALRDSFFAFDPGFQGGVFVGG